MTAQEERDLKVFRECLPLIEDAIRSLRLTEWSADEDLADKLEEALRNVFKNAR